MKKASPRKKNELGAGYKRSDFPGSFVRGKYAARIAESSNIDALEDQQLVARANVRGPREWSARKRRWPSSSD